MLYTPTQKQVENNYKAAKEISEIIGASVNTLISRKRYAVLAMRKKLINLYNDI